MNYKYIVIYAALTIVSLNLAVKIQMPSEDVLNKRLESNKLLNHFAKKTYITKQFADKKIDPWNVVNIMNRSLNQYSKQVDDLLYCKMAENKNYFIKMMLQHSPEALAELEGFVE